MIAPRSRSVSGANMPRRHDDDAAAAGTCSLPDDRLELRVRVRAHGPREVGRDDAREHPLVHEGVALRPGTVTPDASPQAGQTRAVHYAFRVARHRDWIRHDREGAANLDLRDD